MSQPTKYYAYRQGAELPAIDYDQFRRLVCSLFERLDSEGWFQSALGKTVLTRTPMSRAVF